MPPNGTAAHADPGRRIPLWHDVKHCEDIVIVYCNDCSGKRVQETNVAGHEGDAAKVSGRIWTSGLSNTGLQREKLGIKRLLRCYGWCVQSMVAQLWDVCIVDLRWLITHTSQKVVEHRLSHSMRRSAWESDETRREDSFKLCRFKEKRNCADKSGWGSIRYKYLNPKIAVSLQIQIASSTWHAKSWHMIRYVHDN